MTINLLKAMNNKSGVTANGAVTYRTTLNANLDLFSKIGSMRNNKKDAVELFSAAFLEDPTLALKCLFFARDVRGGLGERNVSRTLLEHLATTWREYDLKTSSLENLLSLFPEYGRWDDLFCLLDTDAKLIVSMIVEKQLAKDLAEQSPSLMGKWLPSINASSKETRKRAKILCNLLNKKEKDYRKTCSLLRKKIAIIENNLREKNYDFDYSKQPSKAMLKYRKAFIRNDEERYVKYLESVNRGEAKMNTKALFPYEIVHSCNKWDISREEKLSLDTAWNNLPDFVNDENALVVMDGSGSMTCGYGSIRPIDVAMSLAIYFAERNNGIFKDTFVTFSNRPRVVEIPHDISIYEKVKFLEDFNECANTNLARTFKVILETAVANHIPEKDMPKKLYIISDMEFDSMVDQGNKTNFEYAQSAYKQAGYKLPQVIFWNVNARKDNTPVTANEQGVALVSGASPQLFEMLQNDILNPLEFMKSVLNSERYSRVTL